MLRVLELFGGVGACSMALKELGINFEIVDYVEIDKYAVKSFNVIHNTNFEPQDIQEWNKDIKVDLIMHGSPCQDFSLSGKNLGGDKDSGTRSSLMYETIRIVNKLKPKYVIWENVKNLLSKTHIHNFENYLNALSDLGYTNYYEVLNAKDYGIPQNRERVFVVSILGYSNFKFPDKVPLKTKLLDLLEEEVEERYFLSEEQIEKIILGCKEDAFYVKNATKIGYLEGKNGDGCYISNLKGKRGTVQKEMISTLKGHPDIGVIVDIGDSIDLSYPGTKKKRITRGYLSCITTRPLKGIFVN